MFCENCGSKLPDGSKFCGSCGSKTEAGPPAYQAPAQPPPQPAPPSSAYAPPVQASPPRPQGGYAPPAAYAATAPAGSEPLRVGQYIGMFLLLCIPILNIILLFVWGFGGSVNLNKKNFARASLILSAVMLVFWFVLGSVFASMMSEILSGFY